MKTINLLPDWALQKQHYRRLCLRLAAVQAAIFLILLVTIISIRIADEQAWERAEALSVSLEIFDDTPTVTAIALTAALERHTARSAFLSAHDTATIFQPVWLLALGNTPDGVRLSEIIFNGENIRLLALAADMYAAEAHRQMLLDTQLFYQANRGMVNLSADRQFLYELRLDPKS